MSYNNSMMDAISAYQQDTSIYSIYGAERTDSIHRIGQIEENAAQDKRIAAMDEIEDKAIISNEAKALYNAEQARNTLKHKDDDNFINKRIDQNEEEQEILFERGQKKKETLELLTEKADEREFKREEVQEERKIGNKKEELTQAEQQEVQKLQRVDAEVKAHEQAHKAAAGGLQTSAPSYEYETGPDGEKYAVAGEVQVSYRRSSDPGKNIQNAQKVRAAALAPADPSAADRAAARQASAEIAQAQAELQQQRAEEANAEKENSETKDSMTQKEISSTPELLGQKINEDNLVAKNSNSLQSMPINAAETAINPAAAPILASSNK